MAIFDYNQPYGYGYAQPAVINNPPMYYGGNNGGLFGNGDGWLGVLFLIALLGGGFGGFGGNRGADLSMQMQNGFNQASVSNQLSGLQNSVTTGFSAQEVANCNRAMNQIEAAYNSQIADMNRSFAAQTAIDTRLDAIASALATCCCENKSATQDLKYTISNDGALTRSTITQAVQSLQDKLCQLEMDGYKAQLDQARRDNLALQNQINMASMQASQIKQTQELELFIRPPINPSYTVPNPYAPTATSTT